MHRKSVFLGQTDITQVITFTSGHDNNNYNNNNVIKNI